MLVTYQIEFLFSKVKVAGLAPIAVADTSYAPNWSLAVNAAEVAYPLSSVVTTFVEPVLWKVPLAPLGGAVNVILTPLTGLPFSSSAVTLKGLINGEFGTALCLLPLMIDMLVAGPASMYSYAPTSQTPTRVIPRWSVEVHVVGSPALIAGLPLLRGWYP
ncbi:MAG: hypothetical protein HY865_20270 [Chloroflexi bacterium]|nr:hypothetical protein [Chloroflexota bacterium]